MANPNPVHKFKVGEVNNPNGRPSEPRELKMLKKMNRSSFEALVNEVIHMSVLELEELAKDKNQNGVKMFLASILIKGINTGDHRRADFFINRLIGKVPDVFEGPGGEPLNFVSLIQLANSKKAEIDD